MNSPISASPVISNFRTAHDTVCVACKNGSKALAHSNLSLGSQITGFFSGLFSTKDWPPRWHCGSWSDFHGWLYIISDLMIWASYFAIPILIALLITRRKDIPVPKILWLFVAFIVLCGMTHLMDAIIFWWPAYRLSALLRFLTGIVSAFTVYTLYKVMPILLTLRSVKELEFEIVQRKQAEEKLFESHQQLKTFTHILSHNIRNHTSNISLLTGLIDVETLDDNNTDLFSKLTTVSVGLNKTLNDLADAIKIRETKIAPELVRFDEVMSIVTGIMESERQMTDTMIEQDFAVENVVFPKIYMESILMNLLSNAIKYRRKDAPPRILFRTFKDAQMRTILECQDNGLGIDLALYGNKIFGLYKTFHNNDDAHGVGLFLIKTQIESQGGSIKVESQPGVGTTFKIIF